MISTTNDTLDERGTESRVTGALGLEIRDVDLRAMDDDMFEHLHRLWLKHLVLFFPNQHLSAEEHVRFARRFGEPQRNEFLQTLEGHEEIVVLEGERGLADKWHTDMVFEAMPPKASILSMKRTPATGGDTCWTNQYLAYETLSESTKSLLMPLTAVHDASGHGKPEVSAEHPVIRSHPETGRPTLFVNRAQTRRIVGMSAIESDAILRMLFEWSERPEFQCRYRWSEGTVGIWDNRCTQHYAVNDYDGLRRIERVTILGDAPVGVS